MSKIEVLPPRRSGRPSKAETLLPDRTIDQREKEIIRHHEESGQHLAQSAVHAALAGMELQAAKEQIEHGKFQNWVETCFPFNADTASRYMRLADGIKAMISKASHVTLLEDVFNAPPSELSDDRRDKLVETLAKATEGQSLRQLYLDFGILKERKAAALSPTPAEVSPEERLRLRRKAQREQWAAAWDTIADLGLKNPVWIDFRKTDVLVSRDLFADVVKAMDKWLKEK